MPRGVTISKSGRIWVIKRNNREIGYAQTKANARERQEQLRGSVRGKFHRKHQGKRAHRASCRR